MSLKLKTLSILLGLMIVSVSINGAIHRFIFAPGFLFLEQREAEKNLNRPLDALKNELVHLSSMANDWATWDDTYRYMRLKDPAYRASNLEPMETYQVNRLNVMLVCDTQGNVVWRRTVDYQAGKLIDISEIPVKKITKDHVLMAMSSANANATGFMKTANGPLMVASRPILTSTSEGPSRGTLIMGRFLSERVVRNMIGQTGVSFSLVPLVIPPVADDPGLRALAQGQTRRYLDSRNRDHLYLYSLVRDVSEKPLFLIKAVMPREILKKGMETLRYSMISIVAASVLMLLLTVYLLHRTILSPLSELTHHALTVEEAGDFTAPISMERNDEIGVLAQRYDSMLFKLTEIRNELLNQSYKAGLAGIASDILHHSGNILMPMAQDISSLKTLCRSAPLQNEGKALEELMNGTDDPEREKNLIRFLSLTHTETRRIFESALSVIHNLEVHSQEMEQVMGGLEKFSRQNVSSRTFLPESLISEALGRLPEALKNNMDFSVHPDVASLPAVKADPLILVQVFISLFSRAVTLAGNHGDSRQVIHISGTIDTGLNGATVVRFSIGLPGIHLDAVNREALFSRYGAEAQADGLCASLHWCGNVVSAMGGTLSCSSGGQDTVFDLALPRKEVVYEKK